MNFIKKSLDSTFDKILQFSNLCPYENKVAEKVVVEKFPYIVLYQHYKDVVMILAIFYTRRDSDGSAGRV